MVIHPRDYQDKMSEIADIQYLIFYKLPWQSGVCIATWRSMLLDDRICTVSDCHRRSFRLITGAWLVLNQQRLSYWLWPGMPVQHQPSHHNIFYIGLSCPFHVKSSKLANGLISHGSLLHVYVIIHCSLGHSTPTKFFIQKYRNW